MEKFGEVCGILGGFGGWVKSGVVLGVLWWGGGIFANGGKSIVRAENAPPRRQNHNEKAGDKTTPARYSNQNPVRILFEYPATLSGFRHTAASAR